MENKKKAALFSGVVFLVFIMVLSLLNLLQSNRPTVSEAENRTLAAFPVFTAESLMDGSYFAGIDAFVSDTFFARDTFVAINSDLQAFRGIGSLGESEDDFSIVVTEGDKAAVSEEPQEQGPVGEGEQTAKPEPTASGMEVADPNVLGHTLIFNDMAVYAPKFDEKIALSYTEAMDALYDVLKAKDIPLSMIMAPTRYAMLDNEELTSMFPKEQDIISFVYEHVDEGIQRIDVVESLRKKSKMPIYFNTDHHWSALGAYTAYREYAKAMGFEPWALADCTIEDRGGFLGSMYNLTKVDKVKSMEDEMRLYIPNFSATLYAYDRETKTMQQRKSMFADAKGYYAFLGGDYVEARVETEAGTGRNLVVIKDSYGNAFIPFLGAHFDNIYIVDPRYLPYSMSEYIEGKNITDGLIVNNQQVQNNTSFIKSTMRIAK